MAEVKERDDVVIRDYVSFARLDVHRPHDEEGFVAEQPVFDVPVYGIQGGVALGGQAGAMVDG